MYYIEISFFVLALMLSMICIPTISLVRALLLRRSMQLPNGIASLFRWICILSAVTMLLGIIIIWG